MLNSNQIKSLIPSFRKNPLLTFLLNPKYNESVKHLAYKSRWLIPLAIVLRFYLHYDFEFIYQNSISLIWPALILALYIISLFISDNKFEQYFVLGNDKRRRRFISIISIIDLVLISYVFVLSKDPNSDLSFIYLIPIIYASILMPVRNNLWIIVWFVVLFSISSILTIYLAEHTLMFTEILLILMPKIIFFPLVLLIIIWLSIRLELQESIYEALFEKASDGICFIGQMRTKDNPNIPDMQILRMNPAQKKLTPWARTKAGNCRSEFKSYAINHTSPCPWCPAVAVLQEGISNRSLTIVRPIESDEEQRIFADVSASPCFDEKGQIIAAIKIAREVTSQVYASRMAEEIFMQNDENSVLTKSADYFRRMFKADEVHIAKVNKLAPNSFTVVSRVIANSDVPKGFLVTDIDVTIDPGVVNNLRSCPSQFDILKEGTGPDPTKLTWLSCCIPSNNISVDAIANIFKVEHGLVTPIRTRGELWGIIVAKTTEDHTQMDILQAELAAKLTAAAIDLIADHETRADEKAKTEYKPIVGSGIQTLFNDMARESDAQKIIAMALTGATCKFGSGFSRAIFLKLEDEHLVFQFGIGPLSMDEINGAWSDDFGNISDYYSPHDFFEQTCNNAITSSCRTINERIHLRAHESSALSQSIRTLKVVPSIGKDSFTTTTLARLLRIDSSGNFSVAPIHAQGSVYGVIIVDNLFKGEQYSIGSHAETTNLLLISSFAGLCYKSAIASKHLAEESLKYINQMLSRHIRGHAHQVYNIADLAYNIASRSGMSPLEVHEVYISALAVDFSHLIMPDSILDSDDEIKDGDNRWPIIEDHPKYAEDIIHKLMGPNSSAKTAGRHRNKTFSSDMNAPEKILVISEYYRALTNQRKYKKNSPVNHKQALEAISKVIHEGDKQILNALDEYICSKENK